MMLRYPTLVAAALVVAATANAQCVTTYPNTEAFTDGTVGVPGTFANNWANQAGDDLQWNVDNNGTPTAATGPIGDHTGYNTNGKYAYVEATGAGATPSKSAILQSPCYDLSTLANPYLTFWYHMHGNQMGQLIVDLNVNGTIVSNLWSRSGNQGQWWKQGWLDLSPWIGQNNVRIRFRGITGAGELSDIAIDDVVVKSTVPVLGCPDPLASNYNAAVNINDGTCQYACPVGQVRVTIDIIADNYPQETTWTLKNATTQVTLASGTFTGTSVCVPANTCLVFRINDTAGDGIYHNSYGYGQYTVLVDGVIIVQDGTFGSFEETSFNCGPGQMCNTATTIGVGTHTAPSLERWFDFTPAATGSYTISTCGLNTCDTKLWIYDMACNLINPQPGVEGATFADDDLGGCGLQAVINANMPGGVLHHIRVGTNNGSCSAVTFNITYNGPVVGCMDVNSCNFEPLATVPCTNCCLAFGNPLCPTGPDLVMNQAALAGSLNMQVVNITDVCAPTEGCVRALGSRYVIRFTTRIDNIGEEDYYIGSPSNQPQMFNTNNCHGHAHYAGYADYVLFDADNNKIPVGFKNGYCVIDVGCFGGTGQFGCSNMGISSMCYDQYGSGTTCNWMDITDVPDGTYTMVLRTNWQQRPDALGRHETSYSNNSAQVCINLTGFGGVRGFTVATPCPIWTDCTGVPNGDAIVDCTGQCNGTVKTGDRNADGAYSAADPQQYVQEILGDDAVLSTCTDLNADGAITVTDAALLAECYNQQGTHDGGPGHVLHYHPWCEFPRGFQNTLHTSTLSLQNLNTLNNTVDVYVTNPDNRVLAYEFLVSGLTIQSVTNLATQLNGDITLNSSLGGTRVIGICYNDSSLAKSAVAVPLCRIQYLSLNAAQICISDIIDIVNEDGNNVSNAIGGGCLTVPNTVAVNVKAFLEGPYAAPMMNDYLRVLDVIPATEPHTALGFTHAGGGGGETAAPVVFDVTGNDAIVDWVLVEARTAVLPFTLLATRSALIQRDGDVVGTDGVSPVLLNLSPGTYHVGIRHRNHLGCLTASAVTLGALPTTVDFRSPATLTYGVEARKNVGGTMVLWCGNVVRDIPTNVVKYAGASNDRDPILQVVGGNVPTATVTGYYREDVNLSGVVKYTGTANDRDPILINIGGTIPTATRLEQMP